MKYRRKPVEQLEVEAQQWFAQGDHPEVKTGMDMVFDGQGEYNPVRSVSTVASGMAITVGSRLWRVGISPVRETGSSVAWLASSTRASLPSSQPPTRKRRPWHEDRRQAGTDRA